MIVDGAGSSLGRLASEVASLAKRGKIVDVVNASDIVITGNKKQILARYKQKRDLTCRVNPDRGSKFPRTPEGIVKRSIRGMMNYKTPSGKTALKRIKVHRGVPSELEKSKLRVVSHAKKDFIKGITIKEVSKELGYKYWGK